MTKTEIITALESKFYRVIIQTPSVQDGYNYYLVRIYDEIGDEMKQGEVAFLVDDEGGPAEVAWWYPKEPKKDTGPNIDVQLRTYLNNKVADGTIEAYVIEELNIFEEFAIITATLDQSGALVDKRLLIDKDAGSLRYRAIT